MVWVVSFWGGGLGGGAEYKYNVLKMPKICQLVMLEMVAKSCKTYLKLTINAIVHSPGAKEFNSRTQLSWPRRRGIG